MHVKIGARLPAEDYIIIDFTSSVRNQLNHFSRYFLLFITFDLPFDQDFPCTTGHALDREVVVDRRVNKAPRLIKAHDRSWNEKHQIYEKHYSSTTKIYICNEIGRPTAETAIICSLHLHSHARRS